MCLNVVTSSVEKVTWPALPSTLASTMQAVLWQLENSQWWPPEVLRQHQFEQLAVVLTHALKTVPFYGERLHSVVEQGWPLTQDVWEQIPILTRSALQSAGTGIHSTDIPPQHGPVEAIRTSGSTGKPITALQTQLGNFFWHVLTLREHLWHGRVFSGKLAAIRNFPDGAALYPAGASEAHWGRSTAEAAFRTGPAVGLSITTTASQQIQWLERERPDYLLTFPSVLSSVLRYCAQHDIRIPTLREVRTLAEVVHPELRTLCREVWAVDIVDTYSAQEVGYLALQCPQCEAYHIQAENVLVEVLDESGRSCGPGEVGKVTVTPLHSFAMPLIRYEIGDYAEVGEPCACGRGLPVLARVLGRMRNMLTLPNGEQIWPRLTEARYSEVAPVEQYQVVQKSLRVLEVRLVSPRPLTREEECRLRELILDRIGHPFELQFAYPQRISRGPGGKFEDFRSELEPPR